MRALLLVGHGSLRKASGAAMIRLAALAREQDLAPVATAGFLNFSRPTFAEAAARCVRKGAAEVVVQPYFLIPGYYVSAALPKLVEEARRTFPGVRFVTAAPFGFHEALVAVVRARAEEALGNPEPGDALLLMAHGTPRPEANAPIHAVARALEAEPTFSAVRVAFMERNTPSIAEAVDDLAATGARRVAAVPYFLQLGAHVAEDLPAEVRAARERHRNLELHLSDYLSYDPRLLEVIAARAGEALAAVPR